MDFEQSFNELLNEYNSKQTIPNWFVTGYKTLLSKNITVEDWNRMYLYLQNLTSDDEVLLKILKLIKTNFPTKVSQLENDSRYITQDDWAEDIYTENLHVDVIRNNPEFYFMDNDGYFHSIYISEIDNKVSLDTYQEISAKKRFNNNIELIGDDTKGRIYPALNNTGLIGTENNHFKLAYINDMRIYSILPTQQSGGGLVGGIGSIGNKYYQCIHLKNDNLYYQYYQYLQLNLLQIVV